jgi:hypothetical protein
MQKNYQPDGWLGIILGSKIFVDFTKYSFDECTQRLMKEINNLVKLKLLNHFRVEAKPINCLTQINNNNNHTNESVLLWSNDQIKQWLNKNSFDTKIINTLDNYDGKMLIKLNKIQKTAPEFFYSSLLVKFGNDLALLVQFSIALDELFSI